jgi:hypothetical protein
MDALERSRELGRCRLFLERWRPYLRANDDVTYLW